MGFVLLMLGVVTLAVALGSRKSSGEARTYMLDSNMPPPLRDQVLAALSTERDPAKLETFATALQFQYPVAANALWTRASELRGGAPSPMPTPAPIPMPQVPVPIPVPSMPSAPVPVPPMPAPVPQFIPPAAPAPPPATPAVLPTPPAGYDPGMPPDVAQAVTNALATETDPQKLRGFAASLGSRYPIAAGLLLAKANGLALIQPPAPGPAPAPLPAPTPVGPAPALPTPPSLPPMPAVAPFAVVDTHDPPPLGDLKVFEAPDGKKQIGGAEKNGTVAVVAWNVDGHNQWARIAWAGGSRWKAVTGYVHQQFLRPTTQPPSALVLAKNPMAPSPKGATNASHA